MLVFAGGITPRGVHEPRRAGPIARMTAIATSTTRVAPCVHVKTIKMVSTTPKITRTDLQSRCLPMTITNTVQWSIALVGAVTHAQYSTSSLV